MVLAIRNMVMVALLYFTVLAKVSWWIGDSVNTPVNMEPMAPSFGFDPNHLNCMEDSNVTVSETTADRPWRAERGSPLLLGRPLQIDASDCDGLGIVGSHTLAMLRGRTFMPTVVDVHDPIFEVAFGNQSLLSITCQIRMLKAGITTYSGPMCGEFRCSVDSTGRMLIGGNLSPSRSIMSKLWGTEPIHIYLSVFPTGRNILVLAGFSRDSLVTDLNWLANESERLSVANRLHTSGPGWSEWGKPKFFTLHASE